MSWLDDIRNSIAESEKTEEQRHAEAAAANASNPYITPVNNNLHVLLTQEFVPALIAEKVPARYIKLMPADSPPMPKDQAEWESYWGLAEQLQLPDGSPLMGWLLLDKSKYSSFPDRAVCHTGQLITCCGVTQTTLVAMHWPNNKTATLSPSTLVRLRESVSGGPGGDGWYDSQSTFEKVLYMTAATLIQHNRGLK